MEEYDKKIVQKALDYFIDIEWQSLTKERVHEMVQEWESDGGVMDILYEKGYTDDAAVSFHENMDYEEIVEYFVDYYWFPKRKRELQEIWDSHIENF